MEIILDKNGISKLKKKDWIFVDDTFEEIDGAYFGLILIAKSKEVLDIAKKSKIISSKLGNIELKCVPFRFDNFKYKDTYVKHIKNLFNE